MAGEGPEHLSDCRSLMNWCDGGGLVDRSPSPRRPLSGFHAHQFLGGHPPCANPAKSCVSNPGEVREWLNRAVSKVFRTNNSPLTAATPEHHSQAVLGSPARSCPRQGLFIQVATSGQKCPGEDVEDGTRTGRATAAGREGSSCCLSSGDPQQWRTEDGDQSALTSYTSVT